MRFHPLPISGAYLIELDRLGDERGFFARTWCGLEFSERGLSPRLAQCSLSFTAARGSIRGLHYQRAPHAEAKLVRCIRGAVCDVIVDLRSGSADYGRWTSVDLTADNRLAIYLPEGCGHGFQTLTDDAELFYQMSTAYHPASAAGVRFDDPTISVEWPLAPTVVSDKDRSLPLLSELLQEAPQ